MSETIYFIPMADNEDDRLLCQRFERLLTAKKILSFISPKDMVAIKTHFGEAGSAGYIRPLFFQALGRLIRKRRAMPFLTETQTLYAGRRANAIDHLEMAYEHGFTFDQAGAPVIMADGLFGDEEIEVAVPGRLYQKVALASLIVRSQALIVASHFTGHIATGFGATLKNLGMGCSSRRGKRAQHSTAKPTVKQKKCSRCGECLKWCPQQAIAMTGDGARIDSGRCIGCGECLAVCRFEAIGYNWLETYEQLQKKVVEHALGVVQSKKGKIVFFNFLNRITRDCDCMGKYEKIVPDIGVLAGFDPIAVDAAALDLVEERSGKKLSQLTYKVPYRVQLDYGRELGLGTTDYRLEEFSG